MAKEIIFRIQDNLIFDFTGLLNDIPSDYKDGINKYRKIFKIKDTATSIAKFDETFISFLSTNGMKLHWIYTSFGQKKWVEMYKRISQINSFSNNDLPPNFFNSFRFMIEDESIEKELLEKLKQNSFIRFCYSAKIITVNGPSSDYLSESDVKKFYPRINRAGRIQIVNQGKGIRIAVLDKGFWEKHLDVAGANYQVNSGIVGNNDDPEHGTKVLGVLLSKNFTDCNAGICPDADVRLVSSMYYNELGNSQQNFHLGICNCIYETYHIVGNVILLEQQSYGDYPIEFHGFEVYQLIYVAVHCLKQIVIEPSGNKHDNLNTSTSRPIYFSLSSNYFQNSGAIMVSGVDSDTYKITNYVHGSRIDCYAWANHITTTIIHDGFGSPLYGNFGDTSLASAIIAGITVAIQSYCYSRYDRRLLPWEMRWLLYNNHNNESNMINYLDNTLVSSNEFKMINFDDLMIEKIRSYFRGDFQRPLYNSTFILPTTIIV